LFFPATVVAYNHGRRLVVSSLHQPKIIASRGLAKKNCQFLIDLLFLIGTQKHELYSYVNHFLFDMIQYNIFKVFKINFM